MAAIAYLLRGSSYCFRSFGYLGSARCAVSGAYALRFFAELGGGMVAAVV